MRPPLPRRQYFVRPFQYRLILYQAAYFFALAAALYFFVVAPMAATVLDAKLALGARASSAELLLQFDRRALPVLLPLLLVLFAHSVLVSHRVAGPLYRFDQVLRAVAKGDLSMRFRIRPRGYLQEEARALDESLSGLRARIQDVRQAAETLEQALQRAVEHGGDAALPALGEARRASARLQAQLGAFVLESGPTQDSPLAGTERSAA